MPIGVRLFGLGAASAMVDEFISRASCANHGAAGESSHVRSRCPREAEFVIEGEIDPKEPLVTEGRGRSHRLLLRGGPVSAVQIKAITMRRTPVYATNVVARPPMETSTSPRDRADLPAIAAPNGP